MPYSLVKTSLGTLALVFSDDGIRRVVLPSADWTVVRPSQMEGFGKEMEAPSAIQSVAEAMAAHVEGMPRSFLDAPLDTVGVPPYLMKVQRAVQQIPPGQTRTYGEVAALTGSPGASRAAGTAMSSNRWPILVPCHRVFASNGFGNYSAGSGVHTKLRLLWREGYRGRTSNVSFDENAALMHLRQDPKMAAVLDRAGPFTLQALAPKPSGGIEPFEMLVDSIVSQQLSGKAAATIYKRVAALFGTETVDDPESVLKMPKVKLREAGLSENKALSLLDLAAHARDGALPSRRQMQKLSDEEIIAQLVPIRGIGRWSVQMMLMFYLGRPDVLPVADLGVQKGYQWAYGKRSLPTPAVLENAAKLWAPYASVASWFMWRATELAKYP